jgi:hypothetical protein
MALPNIRSINLQSVELKECSEESDSQRVWLMPNGDIVELFLFEKPPNIKANLANKEALTDFYQQMAHSVGACIIEIGVYEVDGMSVIKLITKYRQEPNQMIYIGNYTFPFRDFSYMVKVQCPEREEITGIREAFAFSEALARGEVNISKSGEPYQWGEVQFTKNGSKELVCNPSEDELYDQVFPDHPLSRARRMLKHLEKVICINPEVKIQPPFVYHPPRRPTWRF